MTGRFVHGTRYARAENFMDSEGALKNCLLLFTLFFKLRVVSAALPTS